MNKQLREKLDAWDLKSVFLTIVFLSIILFGFIYFTDISDKFRTKNIERLKGQTTGEIIEVEEGYRISQSRWSGTNVNIKSYKVTFIFSTGGQTYQNINIIPVSTKNQKLLTEILERKTDKVFSIKFDTKDPKNSLLMENN